MESAALTESSPARTEAATSFEGSDVFSSVMSEGPHVVLSFDFRDFFEVALGFLDTVWDGCGGATGASLVELTLVPDMASEDDLKRTALTAAMTSISSRTTPLGLSFRVLTGFLVPLSSIQ